MKSALHMRNRRPMVVFGALVVLVTRVLGQTNPGEAATPPPDNVTPATDVVAVATTADTEATSSNSQPTEAVAIAATESTNSAAGSEPNLGDLESRRDPFWPIGWKPVPAGTVQDVASDVHPKGPIRWDEASKLLEMTALTALPNGQHVAVLKGIGVVEAGDKVSVNYGGLTYRWQVRSITDEGIIPVRLGVTAQREE